MPSTRIIEPQLFKNTLMNHYIFIGLFRSPAKPDQLGGSGNKINWPTLRYENYQVRQK